MSVLEWLALDRKYSEAVAGLDLMFGLSRERRCCTRLKEYLKHLPPKINFANSKPRGENKWHKGKV